LDFRFGSDFLFGSTRAYWTGHCCRIGIPSQQPDTLEDGKTTTTATSPTATTTTFQKPFGHDDYDEAERPASSCGNAITAPILAASASIFAG
jgi:hypothetical protein